MTTTTETARFTTGQRLRLLPNFTTNDGGNVYWGPDTTLVEVVEADSGDTNIHCRRLDGSTSRYGNDVQWVARRFLVPVQETTYDWSALDTAFDTWIRDRNIPTPTGLYLDRPQDWKREDMHTVLRDMASAHRAGTLPSFTSHIDAGRHFWNAVMAMPVRGDAWQNRYQNFDGSCESIGRFLDQNRTAIEQAPVIGTAIHQAVEQSAYAWPVSSEPVPCYRISDGSIHIMSRVYDDGSATLLVHGVTNRALTEYSDDDKANYRPLGMDDIVEVIQGRQDGRADAAGDRYRRREEWSRSGGRMYLRNRTTEAGSGWASMSNLRLVQAAAQPLSGRAPRETPWRGTEAWALDSGELVHVEAIGRYDRGHSQETIRTHVLSAAGGWGYQTYTTDRLYLAAEGDRVRVVSGTYSGQEGVYLRPQYDSGSQEIDVRIGDVVRSLRRDAVRFVDPGEHAGYVRPTPARGQRVLLADGRIASVIEGNANDGWSLYTFDRNGINRRRETVRDQDIVYVLVPDVTRLRVTNASTAYSTAGLAPRTVVTYRGPFSTSDRAVYFRFDDDHPSYPHQERYTCQSSFEVVRDAASPSTVEEPKVAKIVHNGEEYVRLADVLADHAKAVEILHKGADDNGLCRVYDNVGKKVDEATTLFKMGTRPRRHRMKGTFTVEVSYDLLTTDPYRTDEEAVAGLTALLTAHIPVPDQAPEPGNAYSWRVSTPRIDNTFNEIV